MKPPCPAPDAASGKIQISPIGVLSPSADIRECWFHPVWFAPSPLCSPATTPPVKTPATTTTAAAAIPTDAAIRFLVVCGQRHLARGWSGPGALRVVSAGATPVATGAGSVVGSEFGSGAGLLAPPCVSVLPSTVASDVSQRMCRNEEIALNRFSGHAHLFGTARNGLEVGPTADAQRAATAVSASADDYTSSVGGPLRLFRRDPACGEENSRHD